MREVIGNKDGNRPSRYHLISSHLYLRWKVLGSAYHPPLVEAAGTLWVEEKGEGRLEGAFGVIAGLSSDTDTVAPPPARLELSIELSVDVGWTEVCSSSTGRKGNQGGAVCD